MGLKLLEKPPEPLEVKSRIAELYRAFSEGMGERAAGAAVWSGNFLARYLWGHWGAELKRLGYTWPRFLSSLKPYTRMVVMWAVEGSLSWDELVDRIAAGLAGAERGGLDRFLR